MSYNYTDYMICISIYCFSALSANKPADTNENNILLASYHVQYYIPKHSIHFHIILFVHLSFVSSANETAAIYANNVCFLFLAS